MKHFLIILLIFSSFLSFSQTKRDTIVNAGKVKKIFINQEKDTLLLVRDKAFKLPVKYRINKVFFESLVSYYTKDSKRKGIIDSLEPKILAYEFTKKKQIIPLLIEKGLLETDTIYSSLLLKYIKIDTTRGDSLKVEKGFFKPLKKEFLSQNYKSTKDSLSKFIFRDTTSLLNKIIKWGLLKNDRIYSQLLLQPNIIKYNDSLDILSKQTNFSIDSILLKQDSLLAIYDSVLLSFNYSKGQDSIILTYQNKPIYIIKYESNNIISVIIDWSIKTWFISIPLLLVVIIIILVLVFLKRIKRFLEDKETLKNAKQIGDEDTIEKLIERLELYKTVNNKKKAKPGIKGTEDLLFKKFEDQAKQKPIKDIKEKKELYKKALKYKPYDRVCLDAINNIENKLESEIENNLEQLFQKFNSIINKYYGLEYKKINEEERIYIKNKIDTIKKYQSLLNFEEKKESIKQLSNSEYNQETENIIKIIQLANDNLHFFNATPETLQLSNKLEKLDLKNNFKTNFENCQNIVKSIELNPQNYKLPETISYFDKEDLNKIVIDFIQKYNEDIIHSMYLFINNEKKFDSFLSKFKKNKIIETIAKYSNNIKEEVKKQLETISNNKNNNEIIEILKKIKEDLLTLSAEAFETKFDTIQKRNRLIEEALNSYDSKNWDNAYDTFLKIEEPKRNDFKDKIKICKEKIIENTKDLIRYFVGIKEYKDIDNKFEIFMNRAKKYKFIDFDYLIDFEKIELLNIADNENDFFSGYNDFINDLILKILDLFNKMGEMNKSQFNEPENKAKLVFAHEIFKQLKVYDKLSDKLNSLSNN